MAGKADFWADGQWNFFCDLCGAKTKSSDSQKTWDNFRVCKHHKEVRNPQDFLRGVRDDQSVPWTRPEKEPETFLIYCTLQGRNGVSGWAIAGCAVVGYFNDSFLPSYQYPPIDGLRDTSGNFILDTSGNTIVTILNPAPI